MIKYKNLKLSAILGLTLAVGCTKLNENLGSSLTSAQTASALGSNGVSLLLAAAYTDLGTPFTAQDHIFCLEENTADYALVPTRGGDWDDNGVWRVLHNHTWDYTHADILGVFNSLNKLNFDATNVLEFAPTASQAAQATALRDVALYYLLDLYGQYPIRNPGDNLLNAPKVLTGAPAIQQIINDLRAAIPNLPTYTSGNAGTFTQAAAQALLMRTYLNRGAWLNRTAPTFADSDMVNVITIGNTLINSGAFSYASNYFSNFDVNNGSSPENIFTYVNTSGVPVNNSGPDAFWLMGGHYNQYIKYNPNAGWNGFSTISDFYNSFGVGSNTMVGATLMAQAALNTSATSPLVGPYADTALDSRIGGKFYPGLTDLTGIRAGFEIGQMWGFGTSVQTATLTPDSDRHGHLLQFTPVISPDQKETGANLEMTGIRVIKYIPDMSNSGANFEGPSGNDVVILSYPDVVLMVAEAYLRSTSQNNPTAALALVNQLRAARGAAPMAAPLTLLDNGSYPNITSMVDNPNCLLAERGRELYFQETRRTDLIRFGVYNKIWQYKPSDDAHYNVFPIPQQALASNPNLVQNPGY